MDFEGRYEVFSIVFKIYAKIARCTTLQEEECVEDKISLTGKT